jgi:biofilm protein TabA
VEGAAAGEAGKLMIIDVLDNAEIYFKIHPLFKPAFEFLNKKDIRELPEGKYNIKDEKLFAVISHNEGKGMKKAKLETHRKYIDIQMPVSGKDKIGWKYFKDCVVEKKYDNGKDIEFFSSSPENWFLLEYNKFAVFFPSDAHAPLGGKGCVHKAVIKVAV